MKVKWKNKEKVTVPLLGVASRYIEVKTKFCFVKYRKRRM